MNPNDIDRYDLIKYLRRAGFNLKNFSTQDLQFLSIQERELIQIFCRDIINSKREVEKESSNRITSHFTADSNYDSTEYKRAEVERILDRVNLDKIKRHIRHQSPYQAYRDTSKHKYSNMTIYEKDQIFFSQWKNMSDHEKSFYEKLAEMNYLREEFEIS